MRFSRSTMRLVFLQRLRREARQDAPEVAGGKLRVLVHRASQEAFAKRAVSNRTEMENAETRRRREEPDATEAMHAVDQFTQMRSEDD
jgi:hypothetical protein